MPPEFTLYLRINDPAPHPKAIESSVEAASPGRRTGRDGPQRGPGNACSKAAARASHNTGNPNSYP
ncbi:hypothetical protein, partial [Pseudomonas sp. KCJK9111]|uniref:hypothetical protein n=1 Tax=Pseudomonas sp. KCJK9111 TaxID=3344555 RepID=UPI00390602A1